MLYVIDDTDNEDEEAGCYGWMVTTDKTGNDEEQIIARFKNEEAADIFVAWSNEKTGK